MKSCEHNNVLQINSSRLLAFKNEKIEKLNYEFNFISLKKDWPITIPVENILSKSYYVIIGSFLKYQGIIQSSNK